MIVLILLYKYIMFFYRTKLVSGSLNDFLTWRSLCSYLVSEKMHSFHFSVDYSNNICEYLLNKYTL